MLSMPNQLVKLSISNYWRALVDRQPYLAQAGIQLHLRENETPSSGQHLASTLKVDIAEYQAPYRSHEGRGFSFCLLLLVWCSPSIGCGWTRLDKAQ